MKKILALGSLMLALNGYSQSFMILNNGVTLTTDKAGFVYDFGNFILPYKVNLIGGQYFDEEGKLVTIDDQGFLYRKDEKVPTKIKGKGSKYIIAENGTLYTIAANGFFYKYEKESFAKKAIAFGGSFFTVMPDDKKPAYVDLYTLNDKGNYSKLNIPGLDPKYITVNGGNYFQNSKGVVYTISKDGIVFAKPEVKVGIIKKLGGNYFMDDKNVMYTVSEDGFLYVAVIPANLKTATVNKLGYNYLIDQEGKLFAIDHTGAVYEREMKAHDVKDARILAL